MIIITESETENGRILLTTDVEGKKFWRTAKSEQQVVHKKMLLERDVKIFMETGQHALAT